MFARRLAAPDSLYTVRPYPWLPLSSPTRVASDLKTDLVAVLLKVEAGLAFVADTLPKFYWETIPCRDEVVTFAGLKSLIYVLTAQYCL